MDSRTHGIVLFGDVVRSRTQPTASADWLRSLAADLSERYRGEVLAAFDFTQGDELQGLLAPGADPFHAVTYAALHPDARPMRWAVRAGAVAPGDGSATHRSGPAFIAARELIERAARQREGLLAETGDAHADRLLARLAPVVAELFADLTPRQRDVARMAIVEGRRQAEIAELLGVTRATISVSFARTRVRSIARLLDAVREVFAEGGRRALTADGTGKAG
jgi:hypothetical protein